MQLPWQIETWIKEIIEAAGMPDDTVNIPIDLLRSVAKLSYNQGQIDASMEALEKVRRANELRREMYAKEAEDKAAEETRRYDEMR